MPRIKVLPADLRNKIAAGEVIERPASVVKELIENSLDAQSTDIKIDILSGGKRLVRVSDNGTGMDREDALVALERHATSKLSTESDLFNILTLGFRGEALPAIASVSKIKIITGTNNSNPATSIGREGSDIKVIHDAPPYQGTTIEIRDLFYNTPARKKFLKSSSTELYHIIDTVTRAALSHWHVAFRVSADRREILALPGAAGTRERLIQVFSAEFLSGLVEVYGHHHGIRLQAFVSAPDNYRKTKSAQVIFINRRPVRDVSLSHAVYKAYESILPQGRHPLFFLSVEMSPHDVDFNVHPTKREVRFADKETLYALVYREIRAAVKQERAEYVKKFVKSPSRNDGVHPHIVSLTHPNGAPESSSLQVSENLVLGYTPFLPSLYLGNTFVALSGKGGLTIIDHHAAHERILFEKLLKGISSLSRQLLFPKQVRLPAHDYRVLIDHRDLLTTFGIDIDDFGNNTFIIRGLPEDFDTADIDGILSDIAAGIRDGTLSRQTLKEDVAALIACHKSIRGKNVLSGEEISQLVHDLENTDNPDQCPHGRPTRIFYSLDDLSRLFKRK